MKILESSPSRYDRGIKLLTLGKIPKLYKTLTISLSEQHKVMDIGCGTGLITLHAAEQGAEVVGIDVNPETMNIAKQRIENSLYQDKVSFKEMGVAELDHEPAGVYDYIYAGLVFSELEEYEQEFTLKQIHRMLKPDGTFILIDETTPSSLLGRILQIIIRLPLVLITYILTQTTTHSLKKIDSRIVSSGFEIERQHNYLLSSLKPFISSI